MSRITVEGRTDPAVADAVIRAVFEGVSGSARRKYIEFLVEDIKYLTSRHNDRWGVTLYGWGVRLNVGWVNCLVLSSKGLDVLLHKEAAPTGTKFNGRFYEKAPACEMTTIPLAKLPQALPSLEESHHAALSSAANWQSPPNIRGAHSLGVTEFLSVQNPSYVPSQTTPCALGCDEEVTPAIYLEGGRIAVLMNRFERDRSAREACIAHYGLCCSVCGMSFGERYGEAMRDFIHVHHLKPLSQIGVNYQVDPITDLRPICPNCHAVIHRCERPLSIEQARALLPVVVKG
jgi:5-methylcytosine-specific restriction protein A